MLVIEDSYTYLLSYFSGEFHFGFGSKWDYHELSLLPMTLCAVGHQAVRGCSQSIVLGLCEQIVNHKYV